MSDSQDYPQKNLSKPEISGGMGLDRLSIADEGGKLEAVKKMAQLYRNGQEIERDLCTAIVWQKKYRDLLKAQHTNVHDDSIHALIEAENDLAEMELENGRLKDARNSCWRGLYLCRAYGRGSFYSASRIPYYAKLYMLLGDVFLKRLDEQQAIECYHNDLPIYMKLADENPYDWEILLNTCRCFFKLYDLNKRFSDRYYTVILHHLEHLLSIRYDADGYLMLAKCQIVLGDLNPHSGKGHYEQAVSICNEIVEKHKNAESYSALVNAYLSLCSWNLKYKQTQESKLYIRKAFDVCQESIRSFGSSIGYYDILNCYYQEAEMLRQSDHETNSKHKPVRISQQLSKLYDKVEHVLSILEKEYPVPQTDYFIFKSCAVFYDVCTVEKAMEAYEKMLSLVRHTPILYYDSYSHIKQVLWAHGKLSQRAYQNYITFDVVDSQIEYSCFEAINQSEDMSISIRIEGERPFGRVFNVLISEDVLFEIRSCYSGDTFAYRSCCAIQICSAESELKKYGMKEPTPDEYVYLLVKTDSSNTEKVKCLRCYG